MEIWERMVSIMQAPGVSTSQINPVKRDPSTVRGESDLVVVLGRWRPGHDSQECILKRLVHTDRTVSEQWLQYT